jgi:hypothetical protein
MTEHTPGPWTIEEYGDDDAPALIIHRDSETRVCFMATPGSHGDPAKIEADAKLIAAAPDLLAALRGLVEHILDYERVNNLAPNPGRKYCWGATERAVAAIARATNDDF